MNKGFSLILTVAALGLVFFAGCFVAAPDKPPKASEAKKSEVSAAPDKKAKIQAAMAKLDPADRKLAEAQEWCAVSTGPLGNMGTPYKVMLNGQPVFLCCDGCKDTAEAEPEKTLAKAEELKAKHAEAAAKEPRGN